MEKMGKEKLAVLLREDAIADLSASTVGRILADLKKRHKLPDPVRYSFYGKTGTFLEKKPQKQGKNSEVRGTRDRLQKLMRLFASRTGSSGTS